MALPRDWDIRIDTFCDALFARLSRPLTDLAVQCAPTFEHIPPQQAGRKLAFKPVKPGTRWGKDWQYAWFRCKARVPKASPGKAVVLAPEVSSEHDESIVWINGVAAGGIDRWHRHIDLSQMGLEGKSVNVLLECYAGHRRPSVYQEFVVPGRALMPPETPTRQEFKAIRLAEFHEQAFQLWLDAVTLRRLARCAAKDSLRQHKLEAALKQLTCLLDLEAPADELDAALPKARKFLAPLLAARNGSTTPQMYCFGHSHIDVAWLWPLAQTYRKNAHTFSSVLSLMDRYKEYRFLQSQAQLYDYVARQYPEIYARIKQAAKRGQWIADGAMWVEADMNISGGEALIRQFLLGKRFFAQEFGVQCELCWLPDVFGYNANLPQILSGCGVKYFSTQKIFWNYHGGTTFPYESFMWQGIDGSEVLTHLHRDYNAETHPEAVTRRWNDCVHKSGTERFLLPFGWGDGGGGPTRQHVEFLRREGDLEGMPRCHISSPTEFFHELEKAGKPKDRYVGELYLEAHRGTYTSQAKTKRGNRKGELALREAEMWSAMAAAKAGLEYPHGRLEANWKKVLLNQFHDILPGSSIGRVYKEALELYEEVMADTAEMAGEARRALLDGGKDESRPPGAGKAWTVFNSLSWDRDVLVELPSGGVPEDADGGELPSQLIGGPKAARMLVAVSGVPACGAKTITFGRGRDARDAAAHGEPCRVATAERAGDGAVMENDELLLRVNDRGEIAECLDKASGRQLVRAGETMNRLELFRDNPAAWDAWDIDVSYNDCPVELGKAASVKVAASGPLEAAVEVVRTVGQSQLRQRIVLAAGSRRVDFVTRVDWRETHRLLKVAFPADLKAPTLRGEIQFGHVVRPTHRNNDFERQRFEWPAQKWAALSEADYGIAVLNDSKYGYDILSGHLRLTLLRAPVAPDPTADRGQQEFTYALYVHKGAFEDGDVVRAAYELNVPVSLEAGSLRDGQVSFLQMQGRSVVVETVKQSEDRQAVVVRAYQSAATSVQARLTAPGFRTAQEADMLENPLKKLKLARDDSLALAFRPFEVKTVRLE